jgi:uncharacterized membrane protein (UPF0127 family)
MAWLLRGGDVLAAAEIAATRQDRRRGLLRRDDIEGVLILRPCRQVHTIGMRFPLDIAFCDADGRVVRIYSLARWRISPVVLRAHWAVEARCGSFERWGLRIGDTLEVRE